MKFEAPSNTDTGLIWCPDVKYRVFPGSHIKVPLSRMVRKDSIASFWSETMLEHPCLMHVNVLNSWRQKLKCCGRLWKTMIMTCMCSHFSISHVILFVKGSRPSYPSQVVTILPTKDLFDARQEASHDFAAAGWGVICSCWRQGVR